MSKLTAEQIEEIDQAYKVYYVPKRGWTYEPWYYLPPSRPAGEPGSIFVPTEQYTQFYRSRSAAYQAAAVDMNTADGTDDGDDK